MRRTDTSAWPQLGERAVWDMDSADHECDCPGPPPQFHLPPPPRPPYLIDSDCSDNPISDLETCKAVPVSINIILNHVSNQKQLRVAAIYV